MQVIAEPRLVGKSTLVQQVVLELDYLLCRGKVLAAIEVKSSNRKEVMSGMDAFKEIYHSKRLIVVGGDGMPVEEFLSQPVEYWLE
jgi:hypothetical protein